MAKKVLKLSFLDIVMGAEAETIKSAYEAKIRIDEQLALREEAYHRIAEIEEKVEEIVGMQGQFVFPAPPLPVAGISKPVDSTKTVARPAKPSLSPKPAETKDKKAEVEQTNAPSPDQTEGKPQSGSSEPGAGDNESKDAPADASSDKDDTTGSLSNTKPKK